MRAMQADVFLKGRVACKVVVAVLEEGPVLSRELFVDVLDFGREVGDWGW